MPIIRASIVLFIAETDCTFVLTENQGLLATVMKLQRIAEPQINSVMRLVELFDDLGGRIEFAYSLYKLLSR